MRKLTPHAKTPLFLMEMILSLFILSLAAAVCVQIFAAAHQNQQKARDWNHIQELTIAMSELLEGSDGNPQFFLANLPGGMAKGNLLAYYYDKDWIPCEESAYTYQMTAALTTSSADKAMQLSFLDKKGNSLYRLNVRYPCLKVLEKEHAA